MAGVAGVAGEVAVDMVDMAVTNARVATGSIPTLTTPTRVNFALSCTRLQIGLISI